MSKRSLGLDLFAAGRKKIKIMEEHVQPTPLRKERRKKSLERQNQPASSKRNPRPRSRKDKQAQGKKSGVFSPQPSGRGSGPRGNSKIKSDFLAARDSLNSRDPKLKRGGSLSCYYRLDEKKVDGKAQTQHPAGDKSIRGKRDHEEGGECRTQGLLPNQRNRRGIVRTRGGRRFGKSR